ncbi:Uncharacterised protein [uncultured archaeon]|nr:Uncharacterised protein [uncultured archaeon]
MECEVCGSPDAPFLTLIEGAKLHTCSRCARMGQMLMRPSSSAPGESVPARSSLRSAAPEYELSEGFGETMRHARLAMKLPLSVLAERLAEKESFLERVESEKTHPSVELARKIEKELNVELLEQAETLSGAALIESTKRSGSGGRTLGDIVEFQKKDKKK